jgi:hypothetical protein
VALDWEGIGVGTWEGLFDLACMNCVGWDYSCVYDV